MKNPAPCTLTFEIELGSYSKLRSFVSPHVDAVEFGNMSSAQSIAQAISIMGNRLNMLKIIGMPEVQDADTGDRRYEVTMAVQVARPHDLWAVAKLDFARLNDEPLDRAMTTREQILMALSSGAETQFSGILFDEFLCDNSQENVEFAWVYPDEDGDSRPASVDLDSGVISILGEVPDDVFDSSVRRRIETEIELYPAQGHSLRELSLAPATLQEFSGEIEARCVSEGTPIGESLLASSFYPYEDVIDNQSHVSFVMDIESQELLEAHIKTGGQWVALDEQDRTKLLAEIVAKDVCSDPSKYSAYLTDELPKWLDEVKQAKAICDYRTVRRDSLGTHIEFLADSSLVTMAQEDFEQPCAVCGVEGGHLCAKPDPSHKGLGVELGDQVHKSRSLATEAGADEALVRASVSAALILSKFEDTQIVYELGGITMYVVPSDSVDVQLGVWKLRAEHARQQLADRNEMVAQDVSDRPR